MRKDALSDFEKAGRTDLIEAYKKEIDILAVYLPQQLTEEELTSIIMETKSELSIEDKSGMGKLMGAVMPKIKGRADGDAVRKIVQRIL